MAENTDKEKKDSKKDIPSAPPVFDVSKPGKSAPSSSSRPLIVGHKSMVKNDPMMSGDEEKDDKLDEEKELLKPKREAKIQPPSEKSEQASDDDTSSTDQAEPKPAEDVEKPAEDPKPEDKPAEDTKTSDSGPKSSDASAIDTIAGEASAKREKQKTEEEVEKKKDEVQKLIASRKYFLPIHDSAYASRGFFHWFINILLILLVIGAGVILAIDAGYLDIDLALPFDLIK